MENQENNKLAELEKKADEYLNNWKRSAADFINYKKGEVERAGMLVGYAKEDMFFNVLPVIDSIYMLEQHGQVEGLDLIKKQIADFLKKEGIEEIKTDGQEFSPETMEAVGESESGKLEELQKGYKLGEKVLRPAKVKVMK